eukprot:11932747-Alexandrium_andersonii.AAC.1
MVSVAKRPRGCDRPSRHRRRAPAHGGGDARGPPRGSYQTRRANGCRAAIGRLRRWRRGSPRCAGVAF